jgi:hypothetical protein
VTYDTVPGRCAARIVNGFDRRSAFGEFLVVEARDYPWIGLCLDRLTSIVVEPIFAYSEL